MSLRFHWFLPTNGDGRDIVGGGHGVAVGAAGAIRPPSVKYLGQIARSAEQLGFEAALTPTGAWCEDAWLTCAMLTEVTERLKFLVAFRPGQISPTLSAQMASTFQRQSQGRLLLNVVTGGESAEQRAYGDFLDKDQRYERTGEFLDIVTRLWQGETVTKQGKHLHVEGARLSRLPDPVPDIYFGGSSRGRGPGRRAVLRRLPDLGRAAERGRRQAPLDRGPGGAGEPQAPPRHPPAHDLQGHLRGGLAAGRLPDGARHRRHDRQGPGGPRDQRVGGPEADARAARQRRPPRPARPRDPPEPLGRRRPGPRRRRHLPGRQPRGGREPDRGVREASASPSSSSPATRTWRRHTGSARACCRSSSAAASGVTRPRPGTRRRRSSRSRRRTHRRTRRRPQPATDRIAAS